MVITLLYKNTLIKIKKSLGRFLSLFTIVLVGIGFYAGIRESAPDIIVSLTQYNKEHKLMDFQIVSTMGLTQDDVAVLEGLDKVEEVIPSYSLDVLDQGKAIRIRAIEDGVNTAKIIKGRMPEKEDEILANHETYKVGDKVIITSDVTNKLKNQEFTVVGTVETPLYLSNSYGKTSIGDGKLSSFAFIPRENFIMETYTHIYLLAEGVQELAAYSKEYNAIVADLKDELIGLKSQREDARYQEIYSEAESEIDKNEEKLIDERETAEKEFTEAKDLLDANASKLEDAKKELEGKENELLLKEKEQLVEFDLNKKQIAGAQKKINDALQSFGLERDTIDIRLDELSTAIGMLKEQQSGLAADSAEYLQVAAQLTEYTSAYEGLLELRTSITTLTTQEGQLNQGIATFKKEIADGKEKIKEGKEELAKNEQELVEGYEEYNKNYATFTTKMADASKKIADAREELQELAKPNWIISDREAGVASYGDLEFGINTISSVAKFFPLFFILIVILMTSNTMARMITEERGELGTLTSLGFKDSSIIGTYLFYVLTATVLGAITGFFIGCTIIPKIVYLCFQYILPPLTIQYNPTTFILILGVAVILMTLVTIFFCYKELKEKPAVLTRPIPPKKGQTIFLERVTFLWKYLSFTWKVTIRNIFRYKQRVLMTIVGIAGCTTLLLTGFGIKDSINGVAQKQYSEIFTYDNLIVLKEDTAQITQELETLFQKERVDNPALLKQEAVTSFQGEKSLDTFLIVPENEDSFYAYFHLVNAKTGKELTLKDQGAIISLKLAEVYQIGKGDEITVKDINNKSYTFTVLEVAENYVQNYIYMNKNLYQEIFNKAPTFNMIAASYEGEESTLAKNLIDSELVVNVSFKDEILKLANDSNEGLNNVVILLVCVAALLAIIVLYNLTSINISERKREIATLKVLGFTDMETNEYIYREALLLSLISIGIGLLMGIGLHRILIKIIEGDAIVYFKNIKGFSFLWAFLITIVISIMMQVVTYFKLRKIDMIESLKSVE